MNSFPQAENFLHQFKGDTYLHGMDVLAQTGAQAALLGKRALLVGSGYPGADEYFKIFKQSLTQSGVEIVAHIRGSAPNAPREDLERIRTAIASTRPDLVISFGGGSTIDAVKAAGVLAALGGEIDSYFGTGLVTKALQASRKQLIPHLAIQTAASSSAHLTKYSNITDLTSGQKKLVVDDAIVPPRAVFDYTLTLAASPTLTADGALDGISHALEVLYSAVNKPGYDRILPVALEAIRLVVEYLPRALQTPHDREARQALGLATDLGGYCIMTGGTNGAHLTSFSLVDILSHGRATGMLNPYYTVFFAPAVENALRQVASIYQRYGYISQNPGEFSGRELGILTAQGMIAFERAAGVPATLQEVPGFTSEHIRRALSAAKDPQLKMKLENMPVPLTPEEIDEYMAPVLEAAATGHLDGIKTKPV
jgi:alcohol dehydrogenase